MNNNYSDRPGSRRDESMRQGQQSSKRMRNRNRKGPNPLTRSYESNGGDVKIRGTALHIAEKYVQLARDAQSSGDRVAAENYLQHAEHYYRIVAAAQAQMPQPQPVFRSDEDGEEDDILDNRDGRGANGYGERMPGQAAPQPQFGVGDPQPYLNGTNGSGPVDSEAVVPPVAAEQGEPRESRDNQGDRGNYNNRGQNEHGGYRSRRRRPYRDRYSGGRDGDGSNAAPAGNEPPPPAEE